MIYKASKLLRYHGIKKILRITRKYSTPLIITQEIRDKAIVTINRPDSLNAINAALNEELYTTIKKMENNKTMIILKGSGDKTFSAGGDLLELQRAVHQMNLKYFFDFNMYLNGVLHLLLTYKIPVVSFVNGFVFGASTGLAVFSKYSVATEKTKFCMPEVRLGSTPNGGASIYFNRTRGKLGYFLALTGNVLKGTDVLQAGLVTHFSKSSNLKKIESDLLQISNQDEIKTILDDNCEKTYPDFSLNCVLDKIDKCFSEPTVEEIILKLKEDGSQWAQETLSVMEKCSPTSLKVVLRQLQRSKHLKVLDCLNMEAILGQLFLTGPDGHEGVRVTLIEKDGIPEWDPPKLKDVTEEVIEKYFKNNSVNITHVQKGLFNERDF